MDYQTNKTDDIDRLIKMLDDMAEGGVSRIKVETSENIKEGVSILGVEGTLQEGESFEGSHSIYTLKWNNIKDSYANNISPKL